MLPNQSRLKNSPENQWRFFHTAGEMLPDGRIVEPISDGVSSNLKLLVWSDQTCTMSSEVECEGRTYLPPQLDASTLRAMRFPDKVSDHGSSQKLFDALREQFSVRGFAEEVATLTPYFLLADWFSDCLPAAPCLLITGPRTEASYFLQVLGCLVRHPVMLVEFNSTSLAEIMSARPTLLLSEELLKPATLKMLLATNNRDAYVPQRGGLVDFSCAKVIYIGSSVLEEFLDYPAMTVVLTPLRRRVPVLDAKEQHKIVSQFQPMLLDYRLRNMMSIMNSKFDFPEFRPPVNVLARILSPCLIEAPKLKAGLFSILWEHQRDLRAGAWLNVRCILVETLLARCHAEKTDEPVYVGQVTEDANIILKSRGCPDPLEPKAVGTLLRRSLKLAPKRGRNGYSLRLTANIRRRIHELARDFDVAASQQGLAGCELCAEIFSAGGAEDSATSPNDQ